MRRLALTISILAGAACSPGSGEYGSCGSTPDCQTSLYCEPAGGGLILTDGGNSYIDGGVCRYYCPPSTCSTFGEICGANGLCSKDGGY